jgi:hypothetical protein
MKGKKHLITQKVVSTEVSQEIYIQEKVVPEFDWDNDDYQIIGSNPRNLQDRYSNEVSAIPLKDIRELLDKAEKRGANFVKIFYHGDHREYEVYGYDFHISTANEIKDHEIMVEKTKTEEKAKIRKKIFELAKEYDIDLITIGR